MCEVTTITFPSWGGAEHRVQCGLHRRHSLSDITSHLHHPIPALPDIGSLGCCPRAGVNNRGSQFAHYLSHLHFLWFDLKCKILVSPASFLSLCESARCDVVLRVWAGGGMWPDLSRKTAKFCNIKPRKFSLSSPHLHRQIIATT